MLDMQPAQSSATFDYDWTQLPCVVNIDYHVPGCAPSDVCVSFKPRECSVDVASNPAASLRLDLAHAIVPACSSFRVLADRISISVFKASVEDWDALVAPETKPESIADSIVDPALDSIPIARLDPAATAALKQTPSSYRHEWYQGDETVYVDYFVKGCAPADVCVEFAPLRLVVKVANDDLATLDVPLTAAIVPQDSTYRVSAVKICISLRKAAQYNWEQLTMPAPALAGDQNACHSSSATLLGVSTAAAAAAVATTGDSESPRDTNGASAPAAASNLTKKTPLSYPTSSRSGPKNWDKIEKNVEEEKRDGEAAVQFLFQQLYENADPDTKRAMLKSYTESNGTCLSTNWSEVSKAKVPTTPPDGMEVKQFPK